MHTFNSPNLNLKMVSKRNYESFPTRSLKKRLSVFQALAQDDPPIIQESTRNISVSGMDP